jgi:hypothetical protein
MKISAALAGSLVAGALLAGSGSAHAAASLSCQSTYGRIAIAGQSASWRIIESTAASEDGTFIGASVVTGRSNLWLFPGCGEALQYHNGQWREAALPAGTPANITAATASSASAVWAFAGHSVLFWNGRTWARTGQLSGLGSNGVSVAAAAGPDSVWASDGGFLWHFNGKAWTRSSLPFTVLDTLSAAPAGDLWAAGIVKSTPVIAHLSGRSWTFTSMTRFLGGEPNYLCGGYAIAIYAQGSDDVWAAGGPQCQDRGGSLRSVLHWNGSSWTALSYHGSSGEADSIAPDGSGGIWISTTVGLPGRGVMLHLTGGHIVSSALPEIDGTSPRVSLEAAPGGGPVYGVGAYFAFPHNVTAVGAVIIEQR